EFQEQEPPDEKAVEPEPKPEPKPEPEVGGWEQVFRAQLYRMELACLENEVAEGERRLQLLSPLQQAEIRACQDDLLQLRLAQAELREEWRLSGSEDSPDALLFPHV
ncbi:unnamed protein product, partial [Effrenium voratum]